MSGEFYSLEGEWGGLEKPQQKWSYLNGSLKDVYEVRKLRENKISEVKT